MAERLRPCWACEGQPADQLKDYRTLSPQNKPSRENITGVLNHGGRQRNTISPSVCAHARTQTRTLACLQTVTLTNSVPRAHDYKHKPHRLKTHTQTGTRTWTHTQHKRTHIHMHAHMHADSPTRARQTQSTHTHTPTHSSSPCLFVFL